MDACTIEKPISAATRLITDPICEAYRYMQLPAVHAESQIDLLGSGELCRLAQGLASAAGICGR